MKDISNEELVKAIRQALMNNGEMPLTLIVLDEVQQYIGSDSDRANDVQEVVETCSKELGSKILFVGTGQTAITGTENLKKLEGRFTVRIELSDVDVNTVIRRFILAKKPGRISEIQSMLEKNMGEISRHLASTSIGHRQQDIDNFVQDYPLLPVRRRFWEYTFRVLDQTQTESQLRNQLSLTLKAVQTNLDEPLGHVIPADYLYFNLADKLLQARMLPRDIYEVTMSLINGDQKQKLLVRALGLIFLINKLSDYNKDIGIKATADIIADLMLEDLTAGSGYLRGVLPELLDNCDLVMKIDNQYRIQTKESIAWNNEYESIRGQLSNDISRVEAERNERIRKRLNEMVNKNSLMQG